MTLQLTLKIFKLDEHIREKYKSVHFFCKVFTDYIFSLLITPTFLNIIKCFVILNVDSIKFNYCQVICRLSIELLFCTFILWFVQYIGKSFITALFLSIFANDSVGKRETFIHQI